MNGHDALESAIAARLSGDHGRVLELFKDDAFHSHLAGLATDSYLKFSRQTHDGLYFVSSAAGYEVYHQERGSAQAVGFFPNVSDAARAFFTEAHWIGWPASVRERSVDDGAAQFRCPQCDRFLYVWKLRPSFACERCGTALRSNIACAAKTALAVAVAVCGVLWVSFLKLLPTSGDASTAEWLVISALFGFSAAFFTLKSSLRIALWHVGGDDVVGARKATDGLRRLQVNLSPEGMAVRSSNDKATIVNADSGNARQCIRFTVGRNSVCAGDDCEPHEATFEAAHDCALPELLREAVRACPLASIRGGRATWVVESRRYSGDCMAVVAQQWAEPKWLVPVSMTARQLATLNGTDLYFRYLCQADPDVVFEALHDKKELSD